MKLDEIEKDFYTANPQSESVIMRRVDIEWLIARVKKLESRIAKLREALEFYAKLTDHPADLELTSTLVSFGSTARQALEADGECE